MGADRELLQRAAKAAGLEFKWREGDPKWGPEHVGPAAFHGGCWQVWNPLTDDGDALRLAVKLKLDIQFEAGSVGITNVITHDEEGFETGCEFMLMDDATSATRRAIVVAAAAMPEGGKG